MLVNKTTTVDTEVTLELAILVKVGLMFKTVVEVIVIVATGIVRHAQALDVALDSKQ